MLTHKKKLFRNITLFALALSLVQTCWAGFFSESQAPAESAVQSGTLLSMVDDDTLALKQTMSDDSNTPLLNINSPQAKATPVKVKLNASNQITDSTRKITISLRDSDVRQVLRMFADKAGINVVFHESVEGKVTLDLNDVTLNDAFLLVLRSSELTYVKDGKNIIVATVEASKDIGLGKDLLTVIPLKYIDATAVAKFLNVNVFASKMSGISNKEVVAANPRSNELMIFGSENDAEVAMRIVQQVDKKPMLNVFKLKHTTPREMAGLICDTLIPSRDSIDNAGQQQQSTQTQVDDGDTESNAEGDEVKEVTMGGGFIACRSSIIGESSLTQSSGTGGADKVTTLPVTPLTVTFSPDLAVVSVYGGSVEQVEIIKDFIAQNDILQPMAYIELAVIELNETGSKEFDNQWALWTPFLSLSFSNQNGLSTAKEVVGDTTRDVPIVFGPDSAKGAKYDGKSVLTYTLKYLVQNNKGRVLTNPKLMVTNGQKSVIDLTSDYVKSTSSEMNTTTQTSNPIISKTYEIGSDEGLNIEIIPFISQDGYVSLNMKPQFSTIKQEVPGTDAYGAPVIAATLLQRRNLKLNNMRVKDGETLIIAGLIKEKETTNVSKVPVMGDLPVIGAFFRYSKKDTAREELVIMITPHIVYSEDQIKDIKTMDL